MNKPLTAEEVEKLTFPCLLEVWDNIRQNRLVVVEGMIENRFLTLNGTKWSKAAFPSPKIAEAMRKQFGTQSEYPKQMLVWDDDESTAEPKIVLADLGEKTDDRYIVVAEGDEIKWQSGEVFNWHYFNHAKPIPEPDPIALEIAELRQKLENLEAKYNKQSK